MLIKIGADWVEASTIWRITYESSTKMMTVHTSHQGIQTCLIALNADQAFVDSAAAEVNAAVQAKQGG